MMTSAIPAPIRTLLHLFTTSLADVRFADVDGQTLGRYAAEVESAAEAVASAQAVLDAAREALQLKQDVLLQRAQSALAYARVYAESDEALSTQLDGVSLPRSTRRLRAEEGLVLSAETQTAPRPRGRPRKARVAEPVVEALVLPAE
jgi:multidrug efflux pump subunit AcrA (membrane-fusion protein)